jgi:hypothetical protein
MGLGSRLRRAWAALPWWARWVLAVYLIGFADGTAAHTRDLARAGFDAYSRFPQVPLRVFFISLVLLDPLAVHARRPAAHHRVRRVRARHRPRHAPRHKDRAGFSAAFRGLSRTINQAA